MATSVVYDSLTCEEPTMLKRATFGSAGYDLPALAAGTIKAGQTAKIDTGCCLSGLVKGQYAEVKPRSSLLLAGIHTGNGIIDADYYGHIFVILHNMSESEFTYNAGQNIAQLILSRYDTFVNDSVVKPPDFIHAGFGSTN